MNDLYREELTEIYKHPSHKGNLKGANAKAEKVNLLCGDQLQLHLKIKNDAVEDASFLGQNCLVSTVAAELLLDYIIGKKLTEIKKIDKKSLLSLIPLNLSTSRIACAHLALLALQEAIKSYDENQ